VFFSKGKHQRPTPFQVHIVLGLMALATLTSGAVGGAAAFSGAGAPPQAIRVPVIGPGDVAIKSAWEATRTGPPLARALPAVSYGPMRVQIPAIGVDAPVIRLGLNSDGTLEVPSDFSVTGWWEGGPIPGDVGPAVIVGHVDNVNGPAVFYHLRDLRPGQIISVVRPDGRVANFAVESLAEFAKSNFPTARVYGATPDPQLRLITCGGRFDYTIHHYVDNIVVFAKLV